jgi:Ca-activated chloride channel family protein
MNMKASYSLLKSLVAPNYASIADVLINFRGEADSQQTTRTPLNLSLVLDRSGSMAGQPLKYAIAAAQKLVEYLTPEDILSVVIYDDSPSTIIPPQPVRDPKAIQAKIRQIRSGGVTNLSGGWLMGCDHVKSQQSPNKINRVLLLTDGQANQGITNPQVLTKTAQKQAEAGIITTTLGFGRSFNEDLLIDMAEAAGGNYYFIQSPDEAQEVFQIELESLVALVAQNLTVHLHLQDQVSLSKILNNYPSQVANKNVEIFLGDVYGTESKPLALELFLPAFKELGQHKIATVSYQYQTIVEGAIQKKSDQIDLEITVAKETEVNQAQENKQVQEETTKFRIASLKNEVIQLADQGNYQGGVEQLKQFIQDLKKQALDEFFELAEEIEQLEYYAEKLQNRQFDSASRKEMRSQSYQAQKRTRSDLTLRGISNGSTDDLELTNSTENGVLLQCVREKGKLKIKVISEGYNSDLNVQFPRKIRQENTTYLVEAIELSGNGTFYRTLGKICLYLPPGQKRQTSKASDTRNSQKLQAAKVDGSAADLETTNTVGNGVLVQCIQDGKKLRARVVSDGYNPDYNIRFPRNIREEGMLYVVDAVKETTQGGSYIAYGQIKRFVQ